MAKLVDGIKLKKPVSNNSPQPVSLVQLLLEDIADTPATSTSSNPEPTAQKQTRKSRRKRLKASNAVNRRKAQVANSSNSQSSRTAQNKKTQQRNTRNLQSYDKSKDQSGNVSQKSNYIGKPRGSTKKRKKIKRLAASSVFRPVVLATVDYDPVQNSLLELLQVKRDVRRIKADKMQDVVVEDAVFEELPTTIAMKEYAEAKDKFLENLDPKKIPQYTEALGALGLSISEEVSATDILYSLAFAYSSALESGTRRIDESPDISVQSGLTMPRSQQVIDKYRLLLRSKPSAYDDLRRHDSTDSEISVKCLTSLLAKEFLASYNLQQEEIPLDKDIIRKMFQTIPDPSVLSSPKLAAPEEGPRGRKSAQGICFKDATSRKAVYNYPFEPSKIQASGFQTKSVLEYIDDLVSQQGKSTYSGITTKGYPSKVDQFDTPYARTSSGYQTCSDFVDSLLDSSSFDGLTEGESAYLKLFNSILSKISEKARISDVGARVLDISTQLHVLVEASQSSGMLDALIIYLAFRQEHLEGYVGSTSTLRPGPSTVVRNSSRLKQLLGGVEDDKEMITTTVNPKTVTLSPPISDDATGRSETFVAPKKSTTATTLEAVSEGGNTASLESMFAMSYNDICEWFADKITAAFDANTTAGMTLRPSKSAGTPDSFIAVLMRNELLVLDELLNYDQNLIDLFGADPEYSPFIAGGSTTAFSGFSKPMIFVAYTLLSCRICEMLMSGKSTITISGELDSPSKSASKGFSKSAMTTVTFPDSKASPSLSPVKGSLPGTAMSTAPASSSGAQLRGQFSVDFDEAMRNVKAYLAGDPEDTSQIIGSFPALAATISALKEEEDFLTSFASSLSDFYDDIDVSYESLKKSLETPGLSDGTPLRLLMSQGLVPSRDMTKLFKSLPWLLNADDMEYNNKKLRDKTTSDLGFSMIEDVLLKTDQYVSRKKQKVLCVGIPSGMLESICFEPAEFDKVSSSKAASTSDKYAIIVQKIDQVNADAVYTDLIFEFSRDLFCLSSNDTASKPVEFLGVTDDFTCRELTSTEAAREYSDVMIRNHITDFALRQFLDLNDSLDFSEISFPSFKEQNLRARSSVVRVPLVSKLDTTSETFLSASNIAFDPKSRALTDFSFWSPDDSSISISSDVTSDPYSYSTFEFLNSYGMLFSATKATETVQRGLMFEKIICIPIDDDAFKIDYSEMSRERAAALKRTLEAQREVGVGVETSQGVDMFTYKVVLRAYSDTSEGETS